MKIAIQGEQASFHDIAARQFFGEDIEILACDSFAACFSALQSGQADRAIVAIENSLYGSINQVYDLLLKHHFPIVGEVFLHIQQCLIGLPGAAIQNIQEVHSHPVALAQCQKYLDEQLPGAERFERGDTAASVADIKTWNDPTKAAIGGTAAAELHGMEVLAKEIETNKQNYTRFVVLQREPADVPEADKVSIILQTPKDTKSGALYRALGVFASRELNLLLLHSRPIIGKAWHYMFYLDVAATPDSADLKAALQELTDQGCDIKVLGNYKAGQVTTG